MADTPLLDLLYRPRTSSGLADALPGRPDISEFADRPSELVRVDVRWDHATESFLRMICTRRVVTFARLDAHRAGLYGDLVEKLPRFFKLRGVERFAMSPEDDAARDALLERGRWKPDPDVGGYGWVL